MTYIQQRVYVFRVIRSIAITLIVLFAAMQTITNALNDDLLGKWWFVSHFDKQLPTILDGAWDVAFVLFLASMVAILFYRVFAWKETTVAAMRDLSPFGNFAHINFNVDGRTINQEEFGNLSPTRHNTWL